MSNFNIPGYNSYQPLGYGLNTPNFLNNPSGLGNPLESASNIPAYQSLTSFSPQVPNMDYLNGDQIGALQGQGDSLLSRLGSWAGNNEPLIKLGTGTVMGLVGGYNAFNTNKLAKQQLRQNTRQYNEQMGIQKNLLNQEMADRQAARVASNPSAYEPVQSYMKKYGV